LSNAIEIEQLWDLLPDYKALDVRTPAEFEKGHIPTAGSLPLFTNEERSIVGTIYKQVSPEDAMKKGLDLVGPKMTAYLDQAEEYAPDKKLLLYCWRGGKRSQSMAWLLNMSGFDVKLIKGGYKSYRRYIQRQFSSLQLPIVVLGGRTGCGKTQILKALEARGEQVIDLEGLAHHKGSAFGALGESEQPSVESFENQLHEIIRLLDHKKTIWVENESRSIGSIYIPQGFWDQMKNAPLINLEVSFEDRVKHLVDLYSNYPKEGLVESMDRIKKRLGGLSHQLAIESIATGDFQQAAGIALKYYDKTYQYMLDNNVSPGIHHFKANYGDPEKTAAALISFCSENILKEEA